MRNMNFEEDEGVFALANRQKAEAEAEDLKRDIEDQLKQGIGAEFILYLAVKCIGILSDDPDFSDRIRDQLNEIYGDLTQENFLINRADIEDQRLTEQHEAYKAKLLKSIDTKARDLIRIQKALNDLRKIVDPPLDANNLIL